MQTSIKSTGLAIITSLLAATVASAAVLVHDYELTAVNYNAISHSYADSRSMP